MGSWSRVPVACPKRRGSGLACREVRAGVSQRTTCIALHSPVPGNFHLSHLAESTLQMCCINVTLVYRVHVLVIFRARGVSLARPAAPPHRYRVRVWAAVGAAQRRSTAPGFHFFPRLGGRARGGWVPRLDPGLDHHDQKPAALSFKAPPNALPAFVTGQRSTREDRALLQPQLAMFLTRCEPNQSPARVPLAGRHTSLYFPRTGGNFSLYCLVSLLPASCERRLPRRPGAHAAHHKAASTNQTIAKETSTNQTIARKRMETHTHWMPRPPLETGLCVLARLLRVYSSLINLSSTVAS